MSANLAIALSSYPCVRMSLVHPSRAKSTGDDAQHVVWPRLGWLYRAPNCGRSASPLVEPFGVNLTAVEAFVGPRRTPMRNVVICLIGALAVPGAAQTIDAGGVRAGGVRIDSTGIHSGNESVTRRGVRSGSRGGSTINGNGTVRQVDCRGGSLTVNGNRNRLTATGCSSITVAGNHNTLRWHRDRGSTAVSNLGNGNQVRRY